MYAAFNVVVFYVIILGNRRLTLIAYLCIVSYIEVPISFDTTGNLVVGQWEILVNPANISDNVIVGSLCVP